VKFHIFKDAFDLKSKQFFVRVCSLPPGGTYNNTTFFCGKLKCNFHSALRSKCLCRNRNNMDLVDCLEYPFFIFAWWLHCRRNWYKLRSQLVRHRLQVMAFVKTFNTELKPLTVNFIRSYQHSNQPKCCLPFKSLYLLFVCTEFPSNSDITLVCARRIVSFGFIKTFENWCADSRCNIKDWISNSPLPFPSLCNKWTPTLWMGLKGNSSSYCFSVANCT